MVVKVVNAGEILADTEINGGETDVFGTILNAQLLTGKLLIGNGGVAQATTIHGGVEEVLAGGSDFGSILNGGLQIVRGTTFNATLNGSKSHHGLQEVYGAANGTLLKGGYEIVHGGGVSNGAQISAGSQKIEVGGSDHGAVVTGGTQYVYGFAEGATLAGAGKQKNYGFSTGATIKTGGVLNTWGTVDHTLVEGGTLKVSRKGVGQSTTINGGAEKILAGGFDYGAVVNQGKQVVRGLAIGATLNVSPSSTAKHPLFGVQEVYGEVSTTKVNGGDEIVKSGGVSRNSIVAAGREIVEKGGRDFDAVLSGGSQVVHGTASRATVGQSAQQIVYGTSESTTLHGGRIDARNHSALTGTVTFDGSGYLLLHDGAKNDAILALNAASGATVEFADMKFAADSHYALLAGNLDVWAGSAHQTLHISGAESLTHISVSATRSGATLLTLGNV